MNGRTRLGAVLITAGVALGSTACADPTPEAEVRIKLDEYSLSITPSTADDGIVKIFIDNNGEQDHGLVFVRARGFDELPLLPDGSVDLEKVQAQVADRLDPVKPGRYRVQPELFPGPLVVFCNLVTEGPDGQPISHFQAGMRGTLRVRATTSATTTPF